MGAAGACDGSRRLAAVRSWLFFSASRSNSSEWEQPVFETGYAQRIEDQTAKEMLRRSANDFPERTKPKLTAHLASEAAKEDEDEEKGR